MVTIHQLFSVFGRIGLASFGGPAAQIALMHKELVDERPWLTEKQFLSALSFCMLLPGPEAMQLATYCGWKLRGTLGGLIAGLLFFLPGALVILALALGYAYWGDLPIAQSVFLGIKATVIIIVLQALLKVSAKSLTSRDSKIISLLSFVGLFFLDVPFPPLILFAGLWGAFTSQVKPFDHVSLPSSGRSLRTAVIWISLWFTPVGVLWLFSAEFLIEIARFFSILATVTFGGAYAVLAYMTQAVVGDFGWLSTPEMIDALGLAETTPGPLILVTEFVAVLSGVKAGGVGLGIAAGVVALWVTFVPCFLWIFVGAPYLDWLSAQPKIAGALSSISAAVVGVILNLSVWFAINIYFEHIKESAIGPISFPLPDWSSGSLLTVLLSLIAAVLLVFLKRSIIQTLVIMSGIGLAISFF